MGKRRVTSLYHDIWFVNISSAFSFSLDIIFCCSCIISNHVFLSPVRTHVFLSPVRTIMVLRLLHWMRMIWIQQLTLISTTLDPQLNLHIISVHSMWSVERERDHYMCLARMLTVILCDCAHENCHILACSHDIRSAMEHRKFKVHIYLHLIPYYVT